MRVRERLSQLINTWRETEPNEDVHRLEAISQGSRYFSCALSRLVDRIESEGLIASDDVGGLTWDQYRTLVQHQQWQELWWSIQKAASTGPSPVSRDLILSLITDHAREEMSDDELADEIFGLQLADPYVSRFTDPEPTEADMEELSEEVQRAIFEWINPGDDSDGKRDIEPLLSAMNKMRRIVGTIIKTKEQPK